MALGLLLGTARQLPWIRPSVPFVRRASRGPGWLSTCEAQLRACPSWLRADGAWGEIRAEEEEFTFCL